MSLHNLSEENCLKLLFNAVTWANMADNAASSPATVLYISAHNASPGDDGDQDTNEVAYDGYARVASARTTDSWTVSGGSVTSAAQTIFGTCTGGTDTIRYFGIGLLDTGTGGSFFLWGSLTSELTIVTDVIPTFSTGSLTITCD